MRICENYCITLIRAVMQEQPVPEIPAEVTLQELLEFAKKHSVEALVYHGLCELEGIDEADPVWQYWTNRADMILTQSIVQLTDRDTVFETLTAEGIDLLPIKGCWLKEQYPQIDYRQMSDLDMFIRNEDRVKVCHKMTELGYETEGFVRGTVHDSYNKSPYTEVEMHFTLLSMGDSRRSYYDDIWERAKLVEGTEHLYRLRTEDEYIYYLLHLQKHDMQAGIGIKAILDSLVYRRCYADMDREYLQNEFKKLGILEIAKQVEMLSDVWFGSGKEIPEELEKFAENILACGAYGTETRVLEQRLEVLNERYKNPLIRQVVYWWSRIFLSKDELVCWYPILDKIPALLPLCWIARVILMCIKYPQVILRRFRFVGKKGGLHG